MSLAGAAFLPLWPPASGAYHQAVQTRSYFFILKWEWYEWLGLVGPIVILWLIGRAQQKDQKSAIYPVTQALVVYGLLYFTAALILTIPASFETLARLQPMRSLVLIYIFLILLGGGLLGSTILKRHVW